MYSLLLTGPPRDPAGRILLGEGRAVTMQILCRVPGMNIIVTLQGCQCVAEAGIMQQQLHSWFHLLMRLLDAWCVSCC
jgi:hypothetical protein